MRGLNAEIRGGGFASFRARARKNIILGLLLAALVALPALLIVGCSGILTPTDVQVTDAGVLSWAALEQPPQGTLRTFEVEATVGNVTRTAIVTSTMVATSQGRIQVDLTQSAIIWFAGVSPSTLPAQGSVSLRVRTVESMGTGDNISAAQGSWSGSVTWNR